jgi:hypothetical protein
MAEGGTPACRGAAMSHVFISYKREDELRVGRLARALEAEGLEVWWDRGLPGGESWHANIEAKLQQAGCVVVVWSSASTGSDGGFVREEARRGLSLNILVPVLFDRIDVLPLGFGEIQALDLTRWRGDRRAADFRDLVGTIRAKLDNTALPAPQGPAKRVARRLMWGSLSGTALISAALIAFNTFGLAARLCTIPGPQPGLSDGCGALGLGGRANRSERLAWETRTPGSCQALREHISRFPGGAYRSEAADLLTARQTSTVETWVPASRTLALFEPAGSAAKDEVVAQARALESAKPDAERLCRGFGAGSLYRYVASSAVAERWSCTHGPTGTACGFDGHAQCELSESRRTEQEHCS